jgi:hypothetical protein
MTMKLETIDAPRFLSTPEVREMSETMLAYQLQLIVREFARRGLVIQAQRDKELMKDYLRLMPIRPSRQRPAL